MCVASGECSTSTGSNPKDPTPSKIRSPDPSRTGAMSSVSSSTTPASERLPNGGGAARDVHAVVAGRLTRLCVGGVEAVGDEVEGRPALHLDRLAGVMGEHEHRCVVRRLGPPPAAPVLLPLTADRPEHVAAHDVGAARAHEPAGGGLVGLVGALVAEVPARGPPFRACRAGARDSGPARRRSRRARSTCGRWCRRLMRRPARRGRRRARRAAGRCRARAPPDPRGRRRTRRAR